MPRTIRHQKYAFINNLETAAKFGTLVPFIHCYFNNTYVYQSHQQIQYREYFKWYESQNDKKDSSGPLFAYPVT